METLKRIFKSKVVLSALSGFMVSLAVKRGWLPDTLLTSIAEALSYVLCVVFRVVAVQDIRSGEALVQYPPVKPKDHETVGAP